MRVPLIAVHPEGPRYRAPLVFVPGLWCTAESWRRAAGFLAHRGWAGWIADLGDVAGGVGDRGDALADAMAELDGAPVLVGHDAGGLVALAAASRLKTAAVVWVAPVLPAGAAVRAAVSPWRVLMALFFAAPMGRPRPWIGDGVPAAWVRERETAAVVVDLVRGRVTVRAVAAPTLIVAADADVRCPAGDRAALIARLGADELVVPAGGRFPLAVGPWQQQAGAVHRWLVTRLGDTLLELYEDAMKDREEGDG